MTAVRRPRSCRRPAVTSYAPQRDYSNMAAPVERLCGRHPAHIKKKRSKYRSYKNILLNGSFNGCECRFFFQTDTILFREPGTCSLTPGPFGLSTEKYRFSIRACVLCCYVQFGHGGEAVKVDLRDSCCETQILASLSIRTRVGQ